jgi:hypothetical protein
VIVVELVRLLKSGRYSVTLFLLFVKLPYKLDSCGTDADGLPQLFSCREFSHCHPISGFPLTTSKCRSFGGGKGGGGGESLDLGIDIGFAELAGEHLELKLLDLLDDRYGSEGLEP